MNLVALGLNHRSAPLALRERIAFRPQQLAEALQDLRLRVAPEAAILSTCNRTEVYLAGEAACDAAAWLASSHGLLPGELGPYLYRKQGDEAVRHAFRVACGLDSMLFGDSRIAGQMKDAAHAAQSAGTLGALLHRLFQRAVAVAREVRTHTRVSAGDASKAAAAVTIAARIFPSLAGQNVLLVGTGEMLELCAAHFAAQAARISVAARGYERACRLAERYDGSGVELKALPQLLHRHDIVVSCPAGPLPVLGKGLVEQALRARRRRPVLLFDLAVPRSIDPAVGELDDAFLYTVDDLGRAVEQSSQEHRAEVASAEAIITGRTAEFMQWAAAREYVPLIRALRQQAEQARRHELEHGLRLLQRGADPAGVLETISAGLVNKLMHLPTRALNDAAGARRLPLADDSLARLYGAA